MPRTLSQATIFNGLASLRGCHLAIIAHNEKMTFHSVRVPASAGLLRERKYPTKVGTLTPARPNKVRRHTRQHDSETNRTVQREFVNQTKCYDTTGCNKEKCRQRMPGDAKIIGAAITSSKYEYANRRQAKEHHVHRYDVIQNLFEAAGHQHDDNGEAALQGNRDRRNARAIEPGKLFEEETIVGHGEINSRRGQHALTQEPGRGYRNTGGEKARAFFAAGIAISTIGFLSQ